MLRVYKQNYYRLISLLNFFQLSNIDLCICIQSQRGYSVEVKTGLNLIENLLLFRCLGYL